MRSHGAARQAKAFERKTMASDHVWKIDPPIFAFHRGLRNRFFVVLFFVVLRIVMTRLSCSALPGNRLATPRPHLTDDSLLCPLALWLSSSGRTSPRFVRRSRFGRVNFLVPMIRLQMVNTRAWCRFFSKRPAVVSHVFSFFPISLHFWPFPTARGTQRRRRVCRRCLAPPSRVCHYE